MRNPNGYGSIVNLGKKRRKPYAIRLLVERGIDVEKQKEVRKYKYLGYYATRQEAIRVLAEYNEDPYDVKNAQLTFREIYEKWVPGKFEELSDPAKRTIKSAYSYCSGLYDMRMRDIKPLHLQRAIDGANVGPATKGRIKSLFKMLYEYAIFHEYVKTDYSKVVKRPRMKVDRPRAPFTGEEIGLLWNNLDVPYVDTILILIYTGLRISELLSLACVDVDISNRTLNVVDSKTEAGIRLVAIHNKIVPLIQARLDLQGYYLITNSVGRRIPYRTYHSYFKAAVESLGMQHTIHETRHTFATLLSNSDANAAAITKLIGHTDYKTTERIYTHKDIEELRKAVDMIPLFF